jgi:hypothetical protein
MIEYVWRVTLPKTEPGALGIGALTHEGLEVITNGGTVPQAKVRIAEVWHEALQDERVNVDSWAEAAADAQNYVEGYMEWLEETGADQRYETYAAEEELTMPLCVIDGVRWELIGKLDRRMWDKVQERHVFMDYKTCGAFEDIIEAAYRNEQFPTYEALLRYNHPEDRCGAGVWRMLRKVKRARDGDGKFFMDHPHSYNDHTVNAVLRRYTAMATEMSLIEVMVAMGDDTLAYPRPNWECKWRCPYRHECPMFDDGSRIDDAINDMYVEFDPYERYRELKGD